MLWDWRHRTGSSPRGMSACLAMESCWVTILSILYVVLVKRPLWCGWVGSIHAEVMALPHIGHSILSGIYLGSFFYDYGKSSSQEEIAAVWLRFCLLPLCFGLLQTVLFYATTTFYHCCVLLCRGTFEVSTSGGNCQSGDISYSNKAAGQPRTFRLLGTNITSILSDHIQFSMIIIILETA